jgi:hypothetical protein
MAYVVLKHAKDAKGNPSTILINDPEGIAYEFGTHDQAQKVADLFQKNTTHGSIYEVKKMS